MSNKELPNPRRQPELPPQRDPGPSAASYDAGLGPDVHSSGQYHAEQHRPRQHRGPPPPERTAMAGTNSGMAYGPPPGPSGEGSRDPKTGLPEDGGRGHTPGVKAFFKNMTREVLYGSEYAYEVEASSQQYYGGGGRGGSRTPPQPPPPGQHPGIKKVSRKELTDKLEATRQVVKSLKDQVNVLDDKCNQLKRRNDAMQSARDTQEELLGRQEQDSTISAEFNGIFDQIKSWSSKFCKDASQPMTIECIEPDTMLLIQRVIPSLEKLEQLPQILPPGDAKRRRKFIRGWVALNVAENMFRSLPAPTHAFESGSDIWIPKEPRNAVKSLEMTLLNSGEAIPLSAFHEWRALTFALFNRQFAPPRWPQDTDAAFQQTIEKIISVIKPLASASVDLADLERRLQENVFVPAVELSQRLRRQRACWYVRFPHIMVASSLPQNEYTEPYIFRPDEMKDVDSPSDDEDDTSGCLKAVDIVITPSLYKSGNHDGEQYDVEYPVLKAEVSCMGH